MLPVVICGNLRHNFIFIHVNPNFFMVEFYNETQMLQAGTKNNENLWYQFFIGVFLSGK